MRADVSIDTRPPSRVPEALTEPAGDVVLGFLLLRLDEDRVGDVVLDQLAEVHVGGVVGHARRLLHVVGHDHDRELLAQVADQFLDPRGRDRIERRGGFVEQDHLRLDRDAARDAEALLLPAREAHSAPAKDILDLVPQRCAPERPLDALVHIASAQLVVKRHSESDVVVDRHRERRRFLEHHSHARAEVGRVDPLAEDALAVEQQLALGALLGVQLEHPVEAAQEGRLAAARRTDEGGHVVAVDIQVDALQRMELPVVEVEVLGGDQEVLVPRHLLWLTLGDYGAQVLHRLISSLNSARATTLMASTPIVIRNTPAHARVCQSANGLIANLKIVTGRLAIGWASDTDQNWFESAVNSNGAVSPAMRATASSTPVITPACAARSVTDLVTRHFGEPNANAASRRLFGTRISMFSVVRTTTGITISASASTPAMPENPPMRATTSA